jgi:hypothetical protein
LGSTLTNGLITITDSNIFIKDIHIDGGMTMGIRVVDGTSKLVMDNCNCNGLIECAGEFVGNHLNFEYGKLKIIGTVGWLLSRLNDSTMLMSGNEVLIELTGTDHLQISNTTITGYNTLSTGVVYANGVGQLLLQDTIVQNLSGTKAIVLNAAAGVYLCDVITVGDIDCNTIPTIIEGLIQPSGTLTGSAITYRPASKLTNDSTVTGTTVKDALDSLYTNSIILINEQSDSYILVIGDAGKLIDMNKGSVCTLTVPKNSVVAFPIGTTIAVRQKGIGQVTIIPIDGDVTLNYPDGLKIKSQYGIASLLKIAENIWTVIGSLEA